jgi:signal peptidase II
MRIANLTALIVFVTDQVLKIVVVWWLNLAERGEIDVIPPLLNFRMAWNRGVNFGLLSGDAEILRWGLIAVALVISLWVWLWVRRDAPSARTQVLAGLLIGGALGNVVDRVLGY